MLNIGLVINPYAGIGGRVGLKGSDGDGIREQAFKLGAKKLSSEKALLCFKQFEAYFNKAKVYTASGEMGEQLCLKLNINHKIVTYPKGNSKSDGLLFTSAKDTERLVEELCKLDLDIILFVGGDGTARNVCNVINDEQLVLGIPAGVKIHSGVYSVSPEAAGKLMTDLLSGKLVSVQQADVVDLNEDEFRAGRVKTKYYGEMSVPSSQVYMQSVKHGSTQTEEMELIDIASDVIEELQDDVYYVIGSGTTCAAIMDELNINNTLLGSDVIFNNELYLADATEKDLLNLLENAQKVIFILTVIGGQGHILGRGNHQISPEVIIKAGWSSFNIIATKSKLSELQGRPLQVDTGDAELDHQLFGLKKITTGYHEKVLYPVGFNS
ncbi:MAG: ATP-NAD kinase [Kangiella sp.]|nr:MAG: ATP-NAD kinase [Kangiella sp.]